MISRWKIMLLLAGALCLYRWELCMGYLQRYMLFGSAPYMWLVGTYVTPVRRWWDRRISYEALLDALEKKQKECYSLKSELAAYTAIAQYARETEELRRFAQRYSPEHGILAQVSLICQGQEAHIAWLDVGAVRGVTVDMVVVAYNCLVGRIIEVTPYGSCVMLITDRRSKVPVVGVASGAQGICEGCGDRTYCYLGYVSHLSAIQDGEQLVSSGICSVYPRGFLIGTVSELVIDRAALQYRANIQPAIRIEDLDFCYIIQKGAVYAAPVEHLRGEPLVEDEKPLEEHLSNGV